MQAIINMHLNFCFWTLSFYKLIKRFKRNIKKKSQNIKRIIMQTTKKNMI